MTGDLQISAKVSGRYCLGIRTGQDTSAWGDAVIDLRHRPGGIWVPATQLQAHVMQKNTWPAIGYTDHGNVIPQSVWRQVMEQDIRPEFGKYVNVILDYTDYSDTLLRDDSELAVVVKSSRGEDVWGISRAWYQWAPLSYVPDSELPDTLRLSWEGNCYLDNVGGGDPVLFPSPIILTRKSILSSGIPNAYSEANTKNSLASYKNSVGVRMFRELPVTVPWWESDATYLGCRFVVMQDTMGEYGGSYMVWLDGLHVGHTMSADGLPPCWRVGVGYNGFDIFNISFTLYTHHFLYGCNSGGIGFEAGFFGRTPVGQSSSVINRQWNAYGIWPPNNVNPSTVTKATLEAI